MSENEWKQRFTAELARRQVPVQPDLVATVAHQFWLSSCGVAPEAIAVAVAEAWPERRMPPADPLLTSAHRQVAETQEVLRRLSTKRDAYNLRLLDSLAAVFRDHCSTATGPNDGSEVIALALPGPHCPNPEFP